MANVLITFTRGDNLARFDELFAEVAIPEVTALVEQGVGIAQGRSPIDRGFYRNSITSEVLTPSAGIVSGSVFSTADPIVVEVIENGRSPGRFPPLAVIEAWAGRKLAVDPRRLRSVAFLIARKIATEGILGRFVFRETFREMQPLIERAQANVSAGIAARI
jgi:hypothetical protein